MTDENETGRTCFKLKIRINLQRWLDNIADLQAKLRREAIIEEVARESIRTVQYISVLVVFKERLNKYLRE